MAKTARPPKRAGLSGVLVLDKPAGPTSFDVVAEVRRRYRVRSVGHAGTLDPMATGVLVVMLGEATKLSEYLTAESKRYRAEITFGRSTDTLDVEGQTIVERALRPGELDESRLRAALENERGRMLQVPPAFSAIKQDGETAYKKARRGEAVELAPRPVCVESLTLESLTSTTAQLDLHVSKGYYVRSLARDVSEFLGLPGCLSGLRRLASGAFAILDAQSWPPLGDELPSLLSTSTAARLALPSCTLTEDGVLRARQGKRLTETHFTQLPGSSLAAWQSQAGDLVAIGELVNAHQSELVEQTTQETATPEFRVLRGFQTSV